MTRISDVKLAFALLLAPGLLGACGEGGTPPSTTTTLAKRSGDGQQGLVGETLAQNLEVVLTAGGERPLAGVTVSWSTPVDGGSLDPASSQTDISGTARATWTLGIYAGQQTAQATVTSADGEPVTFTAQALHGPPALLSKEVGEGQSGPPNSRLAGHFSAKVSDQFGNGIPAIPVLWTATNATVSATTVPTGVSGISVVTVTLGSSVGPATVTATAEGIPGSPVTFTPNVVEP